MTDCVVEYMLDRGIAVTRANYLDLPFPEGAPKPLGGELEAMVRDALRSARAVQREARSVIRRARRRR